MSSNNVTEVTAQTESSPFSALEGVSESAILRPGDYLSYYDNNDECSESTRTHLLSSNGKYSLNLNGNGGGFIRIESSDGTAWISHPEYLDLDLCFSCMIPRDILIMEESGNFVLYSQSGNSYDEFGNIVSYSKRTHLWQSNTIGKGNYLILNDVGLLVIYNKNNQQIWSSNPYQS